MRDDAPTLIGLVVALGLLAIVFWVLEQLAPAIRGQRRTRVDLRTDLLYWFFTPIVTRLTTRLALGLVFLGLALGQGTTLAALVEAAAARPAWVRTWPWWMQLGAILLFADLMAYATHRAFHGRRLWRFHAIHHSPRTVDWLSSVRVHPFNDAMLRIVQILPLYALGFDGRILAGFVPFLALYALLLHANVSWTFGPLRYVFASPAFHRWHHTSEDEGLDTNFAGLFPFIDLAFGTFHMPRDRQPTRFGLVHDDVPPGLVGQLLYPFRRASAPQGSDPPA